MTTEPLEAVAQRALGGDRDAVALLARELQGFIYALSLRMLWHPEDAEDATQEILVRIITRLSQFDFRSRIKTWAYRVASNYLLDVKKSCVERRNLNFADFAEDLSEGLAIDSQGSAERSMLTEEVKLGCSLAMLQCLDRPHRLAYALGEIFDLPAPEAAEAIGLEPAAFRKRLERARDSVEAFTTSHCGLVSESAPCQCPRRVDVAVRLGRVNPEQPLFARISSSFQEARDLLRRVEATTRTVEFHRSLHPRGPSKDIAQLVVAAVDPLHGERGLEERH